MMIRAFHLLFVVAWGMLLQSCWSTITAFELDVDDLLSKVPSLYSMFEEYESQVLFMQGFPLAGMAAMAIPFRFFHGTNEDKISSAEMMFYAIGWAIFALFVFIYLPVIREIPDYIQAMRSDE